MINSFTIYLPFNCFLEKSSHFSVQARGSFRLFYDALSTTYIRQRQILRRLRIQMWKEDVIICFKVRCKQHEALATESWQCIQCIYIVWRKFHCLILAAET